LLFTLVAERRNSEAAGKACNIEAAAVCPQEKDCSGPEQPASDLPFQHGTCQWIDVEQKETDMDLEDLLTGRRSREHGRHQDRHGHGDDQYNSSHGGHDDHYSAGHGGHDDHRTRREHKFSSSRLLSMASSLPHFKAILAVAAIGAFLILVLGVILLVTLFPLFTSAVGYVSQNGLQGVVDAVVPKDGLQGMLNPVLTFVQGVWKGSG
jgi:hypothetical protein